MNRLSKSNANVTVTGDWAWTGPDGYDEKGSFSFRGKPTCN